MDDFAKQAFEQKMAERQYGLAAGRSENAANVVGSAGSLLGVQLNQRLLRAQVQDIGNQLNEAFGMVRAAGDSLFGPRPMPEEAKAKIGNNSVATLIDELERTARALVDEASRFGRIGL